MKHPRALAYLVMVEGWERFAYYGLQTLLTLYASRYLLTPERSGRVLGLAAFRGFVSHGHRAASPLALASTIFGLFAGGVYLTPIFGGLLADRALGRTRTIVFGASLMMVGYFLMTFERFFLCALACLLMGVGCFKSNIAGQLGELYAPADPKRADAFQLFLLAVNVAVVLAPLICGTLGQKAGWRWGFLAAAAGMAVALALYLTGLRLFPATPRAKGAAGRSRDLTRSEVKTSVVLVCLLPALALATLGNQEIYNAYLVWGVANYDQHLFGFSMPVTWLLSADGLITIAMIALSVMFWRWVATWRREPDEIAKLTIGTLISAAAPLILVLASAREATSGHKIGLGWGLAFHLVNDIGFANVFPVGLALFSRAAPRSYTGAILSIYYLHLFLANMMVGWLGGLLETMAAPKFWLLHAALVAGGGVLILSFGFVFGRSLAPVSSHTG